MPRAFYNRGLAWRNKGDLDRAVADFDQAIKLDPKYVAALYNRGNVFFVKKDFDRAIADYDLAIKLEPELCGRLQQPRPRL